MKAIYVCLLAVAGAISTGAAPVSYTHLDVYKRQIMDRAPVTVPLQTGLKVIDALIPIGRGQR